jgi:hypothetical protein
VLAAFSGAGLFLAAMLTHPEERQRAWLCTACAAVSAVTALAAVAGERWAAGRRRPA